MGQDHGGSSLKRFLGRVTLVAVALGFCSIALGQNPNVTLTGIIQGPNGLPAANQVLELTPTQQFFVAGLGSSTCDGYTLAVNAVDLACGDLVNFNDNTPAAPGGSSNVHWQISHVGTEDFVSAYVTAGGGSPCTNGIDLQYNNSGSFGCTDIIYNTAATPLATYSTGSELVVSTGRPNSGTFTNVAGLEMNTHFTSSQTATVTNLYSIGITEGGTFTSGSSAPTNQYGIFLKTPTWTEVPTLSAAIRIQNQDSNLSAGNQTDGILIDSQGPAGCNSPQGCWAFNSKGPNNFAGESNYSQSKVLTSGSPITFVQIVAHDQNGGLSANNTWGTGGFIRYCVIVQQLPASNSTNSQSSCGEFSYASVSIGSGASTSSISSIIAPVTQATTGTLTVSFGNTDSGNVTSLACTATTSLSSPTVTIFYEVASFGADTWSTTVIPQ